MEVNFFPPRGVSTIPVNYSQMMTSPFAFNSPFCSFFKIFEFFDRIGVQHVGGARVFSAGGKKPLFVDCESPNSLNCATVQLGDDSDGDCSPDRYSSRYGDSSAIPFPMSQVLAAAQLLTWFLMRI